MYKKLLALSLALFFCVCPVFAVSDADNSYYTFESVPSYTLGERALFAVANAAGWTDTDHEWLNQIRLALTQSNTGSIRGYLQSLDSDSGNILSKLIDIKRSTDYLQNINNNSNSIISRLNSDLKGSSILTFLENSNLDSLATEQSLVNGLFQSNDYPRLAKIQDLISWYSYRILVALSRDGGDPDDPSKPTLYHYVKNLSDTLASDDDKALADAQKTNRQQIEQDFVSGSSGKTSLGASDFGDLSSVGGSVKDSISLNGQSSISGFTGGLSASDEAGQGWFSAETRDALDSVSSSSYGLKRERGTSDIYNMAGFSQHYSWLYGD